MENKPKYLEDLNEQQYEAAVHTEGPLLILAGAGTGKTKTIVTRTAYMIHKKKCEPNNILTLTFTNKAAREMKERGEKILMKTGLWTGISPEFTTFHSWGAKFLKRIPEEILVNYNINIRYTIADSTDQISILSKLANQIFTKKEMESVKPKKMLLPLGNIQNRLTPYTTAEEALIKINEIMEEEGETWLESVFTEEITERLIDKLSEIFVSYKKELRANNMLDFDDLINLPIYILQDFPHIKNAVREQYQYIMVDEFQDTNGSQLELLNLMLNDKQNICVVGDDAQSIYGWRGANINYILNFHKVRKNTKKVNLNMNYRSRKTIVKKANKLLVSAEQKHELKESLKAFSSSEGKAEGFFFRRPEEEASFIAKKINTEVFTGKSSYGEMAVLYRAGHINRRIEVELISNSIPYKIHNGKTLLERKAALEIISYFKFLQNIDNSLALSKILISASILSEKRASDFQVEADKKGLNLINYLKEEDFDIPRLGKLTKDKISSFLRELRFFYKSKKEDHILFINEFFDSNAISKVHKNVIRKKLEGEKVAETSYDSAMSALNIIDIIKSITLKFRSIEEFLEVAALEGEQEDIEENKVNLMTVHASKGLEFGNVFIAGFTQGVFPSLKTLDPKVLEEERRLAYVAITRAKKHLYITGAGKYFGGPKSESLPPSQFFHESGIKAEKI